MLFGGAEQLQQWVVHAAGFAQAAGGEHLASMLVIYAVVCLLTQLLVLPSGSMILIVSGFVFGPLVAAAIYSVAQILTSWPVYKVAELSMQSGARGLLYNFQQSLLSRPIVKTLNQDGVVAAIVLRLTLVVPSAVACCIAATLKIPIGAFVSATVLVCWVRPLFFASVGGALQELSLLKNTLEGGASINLWPIILVFFSSLLLLLVRLWLRRQSSIQGRRSGF